MAKFKVLEKSFINNALQEEGAIIEYDGEPGPQSHPADQPTDFSNRMTLFDVGSSGNVPGAAGASNMQDELDALSRAIADLQSKPWAEPPTSPQSEFSDGDEDPAAPTTLSPEEPGFLQQGRARRRSARLWKIALGIGIPLLLLALLAQLTYHFRSDISARSPQAATWLRAACVQLGCTIRLPMQLDRLSLASSRLEQAPASTDQTVESVEQPSLPQRLTLVALLRNQGDTVQAWPSLDLRLKNAEGTTVVRKALLPAQYLKPDDIPLGMPARSEREIRITFDLSGEPPTGFDLTLFYH